MDVVVLILEGKGVDRADKATVRIFSDALEAYDFCERVSHGGKHWVSAQTMDDEEETYTCRPCERGDTA